MESQVETRVIVTEHAQLRARERGGDIATIITATKRKAPRIISTAIQSRAPRVALQISDADVIPIIEISPRRHGFSLVVVTVLPRFAKAIFHPIVIVVGDTQ